MAYQAGRQRSQPRPVPESPEAQAYLQDYATLLDAVPFPSVVFDHRWDVVLSNAAFQTLFGGVGPHPTAMPGDNFLRFVLFHPDAATVLGEHEASWCLPMLAHFAAAVERDGQDRGLQSIRRDIAQDPIMEAAYRHGLPHWIRAVGQDAVQHDGAVRPLIHPDPRWGRTDCRIVDETPKNLHDMGYTRMTLVLRATRRDAPIARRIVRTRPGGSHLRVV
ncbi:MmyB family transcriptional regulator [Streptomyces sp. NPDC005122]